MENKIVFGTYDVPPITNESLTATYTSQPNITTEVLQSFYECEKDINQPTVVNQFDNLLKGVLSVLSPKNKLFY